MYVRFAISGDIHTFPVGAMSVERGTAANVYAAFKQCIVNYNEMTWDEFASKVVAFGSDGANVLIGEQHSFFYLLKKDCPDVMTIHYIGHRLELSFRNCIRTGICDKIISGV